LADLVQLALVEAMIDPRLMLAGAVATVVISFGSGYKVASWQAEAKAVAELKAARDELAALTAERDTLTRNLAAANDTHLATLKDAQNETNTLRTRLSAGAVRLRIAANCPSPSASASSPSMDTGTGAELAGVARQAYFDLRDGIDTATNQLSACQDELRQRVK